MPCCLTSIASSSNYFISLIFGRKLDSSTLFLLMLGCPRTLLWCCVLPSMPGFVGSSHSSLQTTLAERHSLVTKNLISEKSHTRLRIVHVFGESLSRDFVRDHDFRKRRKLLSSVMLYTSLKSWFNLCAHNSHGFLDTQ